MPNIIERERSQSYSNCGGYARLRWCRRQQQLVKPLSFYTDYFYLTLLFSLLKVGNRSSTILNPSTKSTWTQNPGSSGSLCETIESTSASISSSHRVTASSLSMSSSWSVSMTKSTSSRSWPRLIQWPRMSVLTLRNRFSMKLLSTRSRFTSSPILMTKNSGKRKRSCGIAFLSPLSDLIRSSK